MGVTGNPIALTITWSFALFPDANAGILHQVKFSLARTSFWFQHRTTRRIVSRECILRGSPQCSCSGANGGAPWSSAVRGATGLDRGSGLVCRRVPRRNPSTTRPGMIWRRPAHRSDCGSVHASSISQAFRKRFVHSFNTANKAREADTFERL